MNWGFVVGLAIGALGGMLIGGALTLYFTMGIIDDLQDELDACDGEPRWQS